MSNNKENKMQACYEKQITGKWNLVVHHQGIYNSPLNRVTRWGCFDVPHEMINKEGNPNFSKIKEIFPEPKKQSNDD